LSLAIEEAEQKFLHSETLFDVFFQMHGSSFVTNKSVNICMNPKG
jgi:hypothetical protein